MQIAKSIAEKRRAQISLKIDTMIQQIDTMNGCYCCEPVALKIHVANIVEQMFTEQLSVLVSLRTGV